MDKKLRITDDCWTYGSYHRIHYKKDMLYTFFQYVDIHFTWNVGMGTFALRDRLLERVREKGLVSETVACRYEEEALQFLSQMSGYDQWPIEDIYGQIRRIRRDVLGEAVLEKDWQQQALEGDHRQRRDRGSEDVDHGFSDTGMTGIDQSMKKYRLFREKDVLLVALCQPEHFLCMKEDVETALDLGCSVYLLVGDGMGDGLPVASVLKNVWEALSKEKRFREKVICLSGVKKGRGWDLSEITWEEELQKAVDQERAALLIYGEEGLLHCRNLKVEAVVHTTPCGYHARAMVNQLDGERPCVVYVPRHFDITRWIPMTEKTQLSYWQLWQLWKDQGDKIYDMTPEQLYGSYPQYFLNIYENGDTCPEAAEGYPIQIQNKQEERLAEKRESDPGAHEIYADRFSGISAYHDLRDHAIGDYMNRQPGLTYLATYFTEDMVEVPVPWSDRKPQTGILVHGIRLSSAEQARILHCDPSKTLRKQLGEEMPFPKTQKNRGTDGEGEGLFISSAPRLQLFSNFLFFLTPKLAELYDQLRRDRPKEQLREKQGHLDYQLYEKNGRRVESFPLYHKAVLAKKRDGRFLMCQFTLGGGSMMVYGDRGRRAELSWEASDVNSPDAKTPVQIYTPYLSRGDDGEGMFANTYRRMVGEDRVNLVIIQDRVHCIRRGDVVLPSIGVVISLEHEQGEIFLEELGLEEQAQGYYDVTGLELSIRLEGPSQVADEEWQQVEWAYGGGLSLILQGQSIYGGEELRDMNQEQGMSCLEKEGWLSPLSRQTQESALHMPAKHPRTAIGITRGGELLVLVFSGRTRLSAGAEYREMCHIAKKLIPDVESMMNVDGGGSSVLGMAVDGHFMELSYPATSMNSCAGMVRRVNTVLCLEM